MLTSYASILWDFDGVILDSNSIRDSGFIEALKEYPSEEVEQLMEFHRQNGGLSRYVKFRFFFEQVRGEVVTDEQIQALAVRFSECIREKLFNPERLILDALEYIRQNYKKQHMHIVSGSDQAELREVCGKLGIDMYFRSIHGSPAPKNDLVKNILELNGYKQSETVLIGDSVNDYHAAKLNGIQFWGCNNKELKVLGNYIDSFMSLQA